MVRRIALASVPSLPFGTGEIGGKRATQEVEQEDIQSGIITLKGNTTSLIKNN